MARPFRASCLLLAMVGALADQGCERSTPPAKAQVDAGPAGGADGARPADGAGHVSFGGDRPVTVRLPAGYSPVRRYPLLLVLHPWASDWGATAAAERLGYGTLADAHRLLLALPLGTAGGGNRYWNATPACCAGAAGAPDDVAYLGALIEEIQRRLNVDPRRIFIAGHSNGGFMAHRMACDRADLVTAIVSLAGAGPGDLVPCVPSQRVSVLQVHGDADAKVPYGGGRLRDDWPEFPGAEETVRRWAERYNCYDEGPRPFGLDASIALDAWNGEERIDLDASLEGAETRAASFSCIPGIGIELWTIEGGSHNPDLSSGAFARLTLDWLARQAP